MLVKDITESLEVQNQTNSNYMSMTNWSIKMQMSETTKNT
ncbi:uncharacterized protein METZ01_LOCUS134319 [marine metagenome]|uniref:Uncharacterized protein n=1 Tax=marine metagenome TaxID=408172 RepID=A0A381YWS6_9ZZZZ